MTHATHKERLQLRLIQQQCRIAALEEDKKRLQNELMAPATATARLDAARRDALTVQVDMETLERIEKMRLNAIARDIRDRVMRSTPETQDRPEDADPENTEED